MLGADLEAMVLATDCWRTLPGRQAELVTHGGLEVAGTTYAAICVALSSPLTLVTSAVHVPLDWMVVRIVSPLAQPGSLDQEYKELSSCWPLLMNTTTR